MLPRWIGPALAGLALLASTYSGTASALNACEAAIVAASKRYSIPLGILYAVGLTETGTKGRLHPYALNIAGRPVFASDASGARRAFDEARASGHRLIDLGCMQINHHYHGAQFPSVEAMLDPARNVDYAARFLLELRGRHASWTMAVARYHAGPDNDPAQKKYICRVVANLASTGFGRWTPEARAFCAP
jgi:soluble lytic murein transglycosylase-like protein